ncbi:MAG: efflux transporter outer membrane subunit [Betaproteobacteria bacterium]|nr:efflux transporter outer membrane subunit [Betaproteobacteria bacterium]
MFPKLPLAAAAAILLAGCAVGPDYVRPAVDSPAVYKEAGEWKLARPADASPRGDWWKAFGDPALDGLMAQVQVGNQDLRAAEARYRQARTALDASQSAFFPTFTGSAAATKSSQSAGSQGLDTGAVRSYRAEADMRWEIDLWGRLRRSYESSRASAEASAGDLEAARLSLQASLAQAYFQLRVTDVQRQLLDDAVAAYAKSLELTQNRYSAGVAAKVEVVQAQSQLLATRAQAIDLGATRAQLEHAIAVLIGKAPAQFALPPARFASTLPGIPPGLPSALLERRPDIAAAERRAMAANAQIGVATAAYFPALTFPAAAGYASSSFANWVAAPSSYWLLGPALGLTLLDFGARAAAVDSATAAWEQSVASYRQTVLDAFQEVEDNLAILRILEEEATVQEAAVRAARETVTLTTNQYKAGTANYLAVVVFQANQLSNERAEVSLLGRRLTASVGLIKALGGGWDGSLAPREASPP